MKSVLRSRPRNAPARQIQRSLLVFLGLILVAIPAFAQPPPALRPPREEIAPGLWEAHSHLIMLIALFCVLLILALVFILTRPKTVRNEPPEITARRTLAALQNRPEDGALITEVSRIFRRFVIFAFGLPAEELTTAELDRVLQSLPSAEPALVADVGDFLRECDAEKFAPLARPPRVNAAARALALLEKIEAHRRRSMAKAPAA
jgi:hypothetical protein